MSQQREYYDVIGELGGRAHKIGYSYKTDTGTIAVRFDTLIDKTKLLKMMQTGIEVKKRKKPELLYYAAIDEYEHSGAIAAPAPPRKNGAIAGQKFKP